MRANKNLNIEIIDIYPKVSTTIFENCKNPSVLLAYICKNQSCMTNLHLK